MTDTLKFSKNLSVKSQMLYGLAAASFAVILPHICHTLGMSLGFGSALGEYLLPMHLPVILSGMLCGPVAGLVTGLVSPLVSFLLSGMPGAAVLPFMVLELSVYGFLAGLLKDKSVPCGLKVLLVQFSGRAARAAGICMASYVFGSTAVPVSIIYTSVIYGAAGIVIQLLLIPFIVKKVKV